MTELIALYAATTYLGGTGGEPLVKPFHTMAELVQWMRYNNLPYGRPRPFTAYVAVEHADGSPVTPDEEAILSDAGCMDRYLGRQAEVLGFFSDHVQTPEMGEAHAAIHRSLNRGFGLPRQRR